jgi:SAM-dependent methyltransferase
MRPPPGEPHEEWWRSYFDENFSRFYRPILPPDEPQHAADAIVELLGLRPGDRVLDLACGWGRHAVELARRGLAVVGLDRSEILLREARATDRVARPVWVCGDVRELPFRGGFDAVVCLFSSLGYFLSDAEDLRVLTAVREVLRPGGSLVLETMHRDAVVREYAERDWWKGEAGEHIWVEREFDALEGITHETLRWTGAGGERGEKVHASRVRSATEWGGLLSAAGLEPVAWYGGWELEPFSHASASLVVIADRAAGDSLAAP